MEQKPLPSSVKPASIGKATLSFFLDLAFTVATMFLLYYAVMSPAILNNNDYYPAMAEQDAFAMDSGLVEKNDRGFYAIRYEDKEGDYAYAKYLDLMWNFFGKIVPESNGRYTVNVNVKSSITGNQIPAYEGTASLENQEYGKWVYRHYFGYVENDENSLFAPSVDNDYCSKPRVADAFADVEKYHARLLNSLYAFDVTQGHYIDTVSLLDGQPNFAAIASRINLARYAALGPALAIPPIIFFFILPVCLPSGKTLGKLICGSAVIGSDGYSAPKFAIVFRQAIITFIWLLLALPWQVVGWPLFMLLMLIGYMSHVLSKKSQSLHDKITRTLSIDSRKSVWFASPEVEEQFMAAHPNSPIAKEHQAEIEEHSTGRAITSAMIEAEERILDLSTINKRREEARRMTSFDEFERNSDAEFAKREQLAAALSGDIEPSDPKAEEQAMKDAAMLEGLSEEEAKALMEAEDVPEAEPEDDPDGFTDEGKK